MRFGLVVGLIASLLVALVFVVAPTDHEGLARLDSEFTWRDANPGHGGFSGFEITPDGRSFVAIGDRTIIVEGRLIRGPDRRIRGVASQDIRPLLDTNGQIIIDEPLRDSEGLAMASDGTLYVSFEGEHRVWAYPDRSLASDLPRPWTSDDFPSNGSFEALAIDAQNRLYTLPERSGSLIRPFPVYRLENSVWSQPFSIPRRSNFLPVGADIGPDGRFYLLERGFTGMSFQSRVRRFDLDDTGLGNETELFHSRPGQHDNLEGISVWRDQDGNIRLTMISDNNYRMIQRTEFVEYVVQE